MQMVTGLFRVNDKYQGQRRKGPRFRYFAVHTPLTMTSSSRSVIRDKKYLACFGLFFIASFAAAQQKALTVKEVLELVESQQPQLNAWRERANAAKYSIDLARNTLVPQLDAGYQVSYATDNNISGMSYPGLIMPITGPPSAGNSYDPVPGTALAALLKWTPYTFGQRQAAVDKAAAQFRLAGSEYNEVLFRQQYAALTTYLNLVYLKKLLASLRVNTARTQASLNQSLVLAREGLRPGIDTTQFQSALAQAQMDELGAERSYRAQAMELARLTGMQQTPGDLLPADTLMAARPPAAADTGRGVVDNPAYQLYRAKKEVSESALKEIQNAWRPRLDIWAGAFSRSSGVAANGSINKADGWSLSRNNFGAGMQLSFPILAFSQVNIQKKQYRSIAKADEAQLAQVSLDLQKQLETAQYNYRQNGRIAALAPVQTKAAGYAYDGLKLSYESGLIDYTRLAQGQYDLLKAEITEAGACLQVWTALLDMAVARGNLNLFTDQLK